MARIFKMAGMMDKKPGVHVSCWQGACILQFETPARQETGSTVGLDLRFLFLPSNEEDGKFARLDRPTPDNLCARG